MSAPTSLTPSCRLIVILYQTLILDMCMILGKAPEVPVQLLEAVVAAIKTHALNVILLFAGWLSYTSCFAIILPEERVDLLQHSYDGGGITIDGPSLLVRKNIGDTTSVSANYYVDSISSASIDVITQASPYTEERTQQSISLDYLYGKSIMSYTFTTSTENDFDAETNSINLSQEIFGGMTTVSLGYSAGNNTIQKSTDPNFKKYADTKDYRVSISQVLTKSLIMGLTYEIITDEGFLNNPYRKFRSLDPLNNIVWQDEQYPKTRTSNAVAFNIRYFLPYRAALYGGYRYFTDTWDIDASTFELGYTHPFKDNWIVDLNFRFYDQTRAHFYSSLFPDATTQDHHASDKELSTFSNNSVGVGVSYEFGKQKMSLFDKGSVNLYLNHFVYEYDDFLNIPAGGIPGEEPAYDFSANVIRFYLSLWF